MSTEISFTSYNNTIIPCNDDSPCPGSSICVVEKLNNSRKESNILQGICGCGPEWGNSGTFCEVYGVNSTYKITFYSILIVYFTFLSIFILIDLIKMKRYGPLRSFNMTVVTLLECLLGCLFSIMYHATGILWMMYPERYVMNYDKVNGYQKYSVYAKFRNVAAGLVALFHISMILNVGILWLQVAIISKKFQKLTNPRITRNYIIFVIVAVGSMVIAMITTYNLAPGYVGVATAPIGIFITIYYTYCAYSISKVINELVLDSGKEPIQDADKELPKSQKERFRGNYKDDKMRESLRRIQICATIIVLNEYIAIISGIVFSVLGGKLRKVYISPNTIYFPALFVDIAYFEMAVVFATMVWYIDGFIKYNDKNKGIKIENGNHSHSPLSSNDAMLIINPTQARGVSSLNPFMNDTISDLKL